jgi:hypothetical protein
MDDITFYCDKARHIVCMPYSIENLHQMAQQLNLKRCWFHRDHYDMPKRRINEITNKCTIVSSKDIVRIIKGTYKTILKGKITKIAPHYEKHGSIEIKRLLLEGLIIEKDCKTCGVHHTIDLGRHGIDLTRKEQLYFCNSCGRGIIFNVTMNVSLCVE